MKKNSLESSLADTCETMSRTCSEYAEEFEKNVRRAPLTSVLCALAIGYFLQLLPIRRIVLSVAQIAAALVQPLFIVFVLARLFSRISEGQEPRKKKTKE